MRRNSLFRGLWDHPKEVGFVHPCNPSSSFVYLSVHPFIHLFICLLVSSFTIFLFTHSFVCSLELGTAAEPLWRIYHMSYRILI